MAFFNNPTGVIHSVSPSTITPQTPPTEASKEPSDVDKLAAELRRQNDLHSNYRSETDRRIGELVQQNNVLLKSLEAEHAKARGVHTPPGSEQKSSGDQVDELWNNLLGGKTPTSSTPNGNSGLTPEQVQKITLETLTKVSQVNQQVSQNLGELETQLVNKFRHECPDLHPHGQQVVALWRQFAAVEPDPVKRYNRVITTARELYTQNRGVGVGGPDESRPTPPPGPSSGGKKGGGSVLEQQMREEADAEARRHQMTADIVTQRKRQFQTRTGYPYDQLQK